MEMDMEMREGFFFERGRHGTTQIPIKPINVTLTKKEHNMIEFFKIFGETLYLRSNGDLTLNSRNDGENDIVLASIEKV